MRNDGLPDGMNNEQKILNEKRGKKMECISFTQLVESREADINRSQILS